MMAKQQRNSGSTPLEDYALVSDTHTGALVSRDGNVDWLCLPRFDSQAVFSSLVGDESHGHWRIGVAGGEVTQRRYVGYSMILRTVWASETGTAEVVDFMPTTPDADGNVRHDLVRRVRCLSGVVEVETVLRLRFDYGAATPFFTYDSDVDGDALICAISGPNAVQVAGPQLRRSPETNCHHGTHRLAEGEEANWVLTWHRSYDDAPEPMNYSAALETTQEYWSKWAAHPELSGQYEDEVRRSLVVLRALTDSTTGGIVAAPTTSLPEEFGGGRNWDYRYVWLRDSAMSIEVLVRSGFSRRAQEWRDWLLRAIAGDAHDLRIMYGLGGERHLPEFELDHLPGYEGSRPVRIGNGAAEQYQADVVGSVMIALEKIRDAGVAESELSWDLQRALLRFQASRFEVKDHGLWEMRGEPDWFTHGRAMMWAAFDRGIAAVDKHGYPVADGELEMWRQLREQLREEIWERGWNEEIESFTQVYEGTEVDASLLQLAQIGFVDYDDPKMLATVARIERDLLDDAGFLHRYRTTGVDGLEGDEYPFLLCSYWLTEQYALSGRLKDAHAEMRRLLSVSTDLGLQSEEYSPEHGRLAGNFPQAFSHLGLVRAAQAIGEVEQVD